MPRPIVAAGDSSSAAPHARDRCHGPFASVLGRIGPIQLASDLFALPYARPYTIALYVKMATYAVMTLLAVPLVRAARRQAAEWIDLPPADEAGEDGAAVDGRTQPRLGLLSRASIGSLFVGGAIIFVCVTALKYLHILSETVRGLL